jgi:hypothetical protein
VSNKGLRVLASVGLAVKCRGWPGLMMAGWGYRLTGKFRCRSPNSGLHLHLHDRREGAASTSVRSRATRPGHRDTASPEAR